jgi:YidC/Oxa1 family membrane protein insertase
VEQRRLLLTFAISLVLLLLYEQLVLRKYQKPSRQAPVAQETAPSQAVPAEAGPPSSLAGPAEPGELVVVETEIFRASITAAGGRLVGFELKPYRRTVSPDSEALDLVRPGPVLPMTLQFGNDASDASLRYRPDHSHLALQGQERGQIVFTATAPEGFQVEKRYRFTGDDYLFEVGATMSGANVPATLGLVVAAMPPEGHTAKSAEVAIAFSKGRLTQKSPTDLQKGALKVDGSSWGGFAMQYFLVAAAAASGAAQAVMTTAESVPIVRLDEPLGDGKAEFAVYMGPKAQEALRRAGHDLDRALDFGMFWFIAVPLLHALRMLHSVTGNYGVAIIVLTTLVKVGTIPLTRATFRNMREMQKIQPQMMKLRERYKDDQAALQKEMMELYRRHRVNPLSGCLPMLLQLPIFVGLYNTLLYAIELRHAPFALWINDLSAPDRLMLGGLGVPVLTLLMGASMLLQQWLTPQQGDPTQQRMMMFMPVIFTFMFINFPAGLVLYWLVNNVLSIGQQYYMMRYTR